MSDLIHVDLNLTNACNFACAHCHSSSGTPDDQELSTEQIASVLEEIYNLGVVSLAIAGGEPLLRKDIFELLAVAESLGSMRTVVVTNGSLLSTTTLKRMKAVAPSVGLSISLDGATPEQFGRLRARPRASTAATAVLFNRIVRSIREAISEGLDTFVNFTMTNESLSDLDEAYRFAIEDLGAAALVAIKFFPSGYGRRELDRLDIPWSRWLPYFWQLSKRRLGGEMPALQLSLPSAWEFYLPLIMAGMDIQDAEKVWNNQSPLRDWAYSRDRTLGDPLGVTNVAICGDGSVYPSVLLVGEDALNCGNVTDRSLRNVWDDSSVLESVRHLTLPDLDAPCAMCPISHVCGGGSRARAYFETGSISGPDVACPILAGSFDGV